jgi:hypothetical protein
VKITTSSSFSFTFPVALAPALARPRKLSSSFALAFSSRGGWASLWRTVTLKVGTDGRNWVEASAVCKFPHLFPGVEVDHEGLLGLVVGTIQVLRHIVLVGLVLVLSLVVVKLVLFSVITFFVVVVVLFVVLPKVAMAVSNLSRSRCNAIF